jgi:hypothetical protein
MLLKQEVAGVMKICPMADGQEDHPASSMYSSTSSMYSSTSSMYSSTSSMYSSTSSMYSSTSSIYSSTSSMYSSTSSRSVWPTCYRIGQKPIRILRRAKMLTLCGFPRKQWSIICWMAWGWNVSIWDGLITLWRKLEKPRGYHAHKRWFDSLTIKCELDSNIHSQRTSRGCTMTSPQRKCCHWIGSLSVSECVWPIIDGKQRSLSFSGIRKSPSYLFSLKVEN